MFGKRESVVYDPLPTDLEGSQGIVSGQQQQERGGLAARLSRHGIAIVSIVFNILLLAYISLHGDVPPTICRSHYAGLVNDVPTPFKWVTEYSDPNNAQRDELWEGNLGGSLDFNMVAFTEQESDAMGLPRSEVPYIWDQDKGTYSVEGHHSLHCLHLMYMALKDYRDGVEQRTPHEHIIHCMDSLRQQVLCHADDTPRYLTKNGTWAGQDQMRMCRDFSKLNDWSREHDACYRYLEPLGDEVAEVERYKYCKREGRDMERVRKFFSLPTSWQPFPFKQQKTFMTKTQLSELLHSFDEKTKQFLGFS